MKDLKKNVVYTQELKVKLDQLLKMSNELANEKSGKSLAQFLDEMNFISVQLTEIIREVITHGSLNL